MTTFAVRGAVAAVRAWTAVYTWGLPADQRQRRVEEIESDIWESLHDPGAAATSHALQITRRWIAGIPDDLLWRSEHVHVTGSRIWRVALTVLAIALIGLWLNRASQPEMPLHEMMKLVPEPKFEPRLIDTPPPAPPPPPPCPPDGFPQPSGRCSR